MLRHDSDHVQDLLPAYLNGSLSPDEHNTVALHLDRCASCREELNEWKAIARASEAANIAAPAPSESVLRSIQERIEQPSPANAPRISFGLHYLWQLLVGQIPLVRRGIWLAGPMTIAIGCVVAMTARVPEDSGMVLAMVAPVVAAVSMAMIYGQENDPSLELAWSTATSPRLVLLARMTLVFAYDLVLALAATIVLMAAVGDLSLLSLVSLWIAPMLFLSALALATSLILGTATAITGALVIWAARVFAATSGSVDAGQTSEIAEMINAFWEAGPVLLALFAVITVFTLVAMPRQERFA